jgi:hypothetical protein
MPLLLQHHLYPLLLRTLSDRSAFPLALRRAHIVLHSLKQISSELETEATVKLITGETDAGEPRAGWMRVRDGDYGG